MDKKEELFKKEKHIQKLITNAVTKLTNCIINNKLSSDHHDGEDDWTYNYALARALLAMTTTMYLEFGSGKEGLVIEILEEIDFQNKREKNGETDYSKSCEYRNKYPDKRNDKDVN